MKRGVKGIAPEEKKLQDVDAAPPLRQRAGGLGGARHGARRRLRAGGALARRRVAAMESYIGLVEVGVGLIPGGGGLTYIARRAAENAARQRRTPTCCDFLTEGFTTAAMAKVGTSALEVAQARLPARQRRHRAATRTSCCYVAIAQAKAMSDERLPPAAAARCSRSPAASAIATIKAQLVNMRDGGFISAHDFHIGTPDRRRGLRRRRRCRLAGRPRST